MDLREIAIPILTEFQLNKSDRSYYFSKHGYSIRISDHLAKNSNSNIHFVQVEDQIIIWKPGGTPSLSDPKRLVGYFNKIVSISEAIDILCLINNSSKYFLP